MTITVVELLKQLAVAVPSILAGVMLVTSAIDEGFNITNKNWRHAISWILAVVTAVIFTATGQLTFGLGGWDYAISVVFGVIAGGAANGIYDWPAVTKIIDAFGKLFVPKSRKQSQEPEPAAEPEPVVEEVVVAAAPKRRSRKPKTETTDKK